MIYDLQFNTLLIYFYIMAVSRTPEITSAIKSLVKPRSFPANFYRTFCRSENIETYTPSLDEIELISEITRDLESDVVRNLFLVSCQQGYRTVAITLFLKYTNTCIDLFKETVDVIHDGQWNMSSGQIGIVFLYLDWRNVAFADWLIRLINKTIEPNNQLWYGINGCMFYNMPAFVYNRDVMQRLSTLQSTMIKPPHSKMIHSGRGWGGRGWWAKMPKEALDPIDICMNWTGASAKAAKIRALVNWMYEYYKSSFYDVFPMDSDLDEIYILYEALTDFIRVKYPNTRNYEILCDAVNVGIPYLEVHNDTKTLGMINNIFD